MAVNSETTVGELITSVEKETGEHFSPERILKMLVTRANSKQKGKAKRERVKKMLGKLQDKYGKDFDVDEILGALEGD